MRRIILCGVATLAMGLAARAEAATATANLNVTATVSDACSVADASLAFGTVVPATGTVTPISGSIGVTCTLGTAFTVGLGTGQNLTGGTTRRMRKSATTSYLTYEIYKDSGATTRFGDTGSSDRAAGTGTGLSTAVSFYGTVASGQSSATGAYADTVTITVYY